MECLSRVPTDPRTHFLGATIPRLADLERKQVDAGRCVFPLKLSCLGPCLSWCRGARGRYWDRAHWALLSFHWGRSRGDRSGIRSRDLLLILIVALILQDGRESSKPISRAGEPPPSAFIWRLLRRLRLLLLDDRRAWPLCWGLYPRGALSTS